jgi:hypothetical protein
MIVNKYKANKTFPLLRLRFIENNEKMKYKLMTEISA